MEKASAELNCGFNDVIDLHSGTNLSVIMSQESLSSSGLSNNTSGRTGLVPKSLTFECIAFPNAQKFLEICCCFYIVLSNCTVLVSILKVSSECLHLFFKLRYDSTIYFWSYLLMFLRVD